MLIPCTPLYAHAYEDARPVFVRDNATPVVEEGRALALA